MITYIIRRVLISIPVLFFVVLATFLLIHAVPGGPFDNVGTRPMPPTVRERLENRYGLNDPLPQQFFRYMSNLLQGDLGPLFDSPSRDVNDIVRESFPISIQLGLMALLVGFGMGIPAGIIAALRHNSLIDYTATFLAVLSASIPNLVLGPVLILLFGVYLRWFDFPGWGSEPPYVLGFLPKFTEMFGDGARYFELAIMPVLALGAGFAAAIARLTRAGLLEVLGSDYVRTAYSKGLKSITVIVIHALKNSLIPVATILGPLLAGAVTGSLITENIFAINGLGRQFVASIAQREYFLLTSLTLIFAILLIIGNLLVDIIYAWLDPRIRFD
ncbi:MAG: ABC transporter permease [Chloroflexi bacterium]|nr:ABC transporter permease [Chloroflexota bacterium]MBP8056797.1 ABC transporter permease [Chloroflexota bacterium]